MLWFEKENGVKTGLKNSKVKANLLYAIGGNTLKVGENCICGSGRKFEVCCELYIDKTIEDYKVELKKIIKLMHTILQ